MIPRQWSDKVLVAISSSVVLLYCVVVLAYVATFPDLRLRVLLTDAPDAQAASGMVIRDVPGIRCSGPQPVVGDVLRRIGDQPIHSFNDFSRSLRRLRRAQIPPGGLLNSGDDPALVREPLPSLVELETGERLIAVAFLHGGVPQTSWVFVQSLPLDEMLLTLIWFLLQLGITAVGALAVWHRPFDRPARVFFAMCVVTLGAFVGGFHWWIVASSLPLNVPFVGCALFVPVVSLHFFLVYPRRIWPLTRFPRIALAALYVVPSITFLWMIGMLGYGHWLAQSGLADATELILKSLVTLREGIYAYLTFAAGCFLVMLTALAQGYLRTANPIERNQLKWMFWGGVDAVPKSHQ